MLKKIWQRIRQNHLLLMTVCCLVPVIVVIALLLLYKGSSNYWVWLVILLCPILHILTMRSHGHNNAYKKEPDKESYEEALYRCPECGFEYKEKELAKKCETWCKKYKSCNLEIIKYAISKGRPQ